MAQRKMELEDWLDDLCVRFIINLPNEDLSSVARICFQIEEAQWFYEDFIRPLDPNLPSLTLRNFCMRIFQHCPLLSSFSVENHMKAFEEFLQYKTRIPVRGAILLNDAMDSAVLVKGWKKGASWSFPRGKINKDEDDLDCAVREVYEETGYDIKEAGLISDPDRVKFIDIPMREQQIRLYVIPNVPMDTVFQPRTRKEISKIQWYKLSELPAFRKKGNHQRDEAEAAANANRFYMVAPFLVELRKWVVKQKKKDQLRGVHHNHLTAQILTEEAYTEDEFGNHTDHAPGPPLSAVAMDTLEGATRELQRLLKVQPATQGLQVNPAAPAGHDKAEALMAILQKKAVSSNQAPTFAQPQVPHTPLDMVYTTAPQPHTPHHHHPSQRLPQNMAQQPPNFPYPPQAPPNQSAPYQNAPRVPVHFQQQYQGYGAAPFILPVSQRHNPEPVLLHPQPLPPQVQQSVLTRGILPTPAVQELVRRNGDHASQIPPNSQYHQSAMPQHAPQPPPAPSQLDSHKMSLLQAFKVNEASREEPPVQAAPIAQPAQQPRGWADVSSSLSSLPYGASNNAGSMRPQVVINEAHGLHVSGSAVRPGPKPADDKQRATLLDMFKKQDTQSPTSSDATKPVQRNHQSAASYTREAAQGPIAQPQSSAEAIAAAAKARGGPVEVNPELNLPFGALSILSRPKQNENRPNRDFESPQVPYHISNIAKQPSVSSGAPSPRHLPPPSVHSPAWQQAPPANAAMAALASQHLPYHHQQQHHQHHQHHHQQQQQPLASPQGGVTPRRQDVSSEQKQKLMSLFGVSPGSSAAGGALPDDKGKGREPHPFADHARPRSRVASIASASAEGGSGSGTGSRRGSRTPISPADQTFLLNYLRSVPTAGNVGH